MVDSGNRGEGRDRQRRKSYVESSQTADAVRARFNKADYVRGFPTTGSFPPSQEERLSQLETRPNFAESGVQSVPGDKGFLYADTPQATVFLGKKQWFIGDWTYNVETDVAIPDQKEGEKSPELKGREYETIKRDLFERVILRKLQWLSNHEAFTKLTNKLDVAAQFGRISQEEVAKLRASISSIENGENTLTETDLAQIMDLDAVPVGLGNANTTRYYVTPINSRSSNSAIATYNRKLQELRVLERFATPDDEDSLDEIIENQQDLVDALTATVAELQKQIKSISERKDVIIKELQEGKIIAEDPNSDRVVVLEEELEKADLQLKGLLEQLSSKSGALTEMTLVLQEYKEKKNVEPDLETLREEVKFLREEAQKELKELKRLVPLKSFNGVIEFNNITQVSTNVSIAGQGSASFTMENPNNILRIGRDDILLALSDDPYNEVSLTGDPTSPAQEVLHTTYVRSKDSPELNAQNIASELNTGNLVFYKGRYYDPAGLKVVLENTGGELEATTGLTTSEISLKLTTYRRFQRVVLEEISARLLALPQFLRQRFEDTLQLPTEAQSMHSGWLKRNKNVVVDIFNASVTTDESEQSAEETVGAKIITSYIRRLQKLEDELTDQVISFEYIPEDAQNADGDENDTRKAESATNRKPPKRIMFNALSDVVSTEVQQLRIFKDLQKDFVGKYVVEVADRIWVWMTSPSRTVQIDDNELGMAESVVGRAAAEIGNATVLKQAREELSDITAQIAVLKDERDTLLAQYGDRLAEHDALIDEYRKRGVNPDDPEAFVEALTAEQTDKIENLEEERERLEGEIIDLETEVLWIDPTSKERTLGNIDEGLIEAQEVKSYEEALARSKAKLEEALKGFTTTRIQLNRTDLSQQERLRLEKQLAEYGKTADFEKSWVSFYETALEREKVKLHERLVVIEEQQKKVDEKEKEILLTERELAAERNTLNDVQTDVQQKETRRRNELERVMSAETLLRFDQIDGQLEELSERYEKKFKEVAKLENEYTTARQPEGLGPGENASDGRSALPKEGDYSAITLGSAASSLPPSAVLLSKFGGLEEQQFQVFEGVITQVTGTFNGTEFTINVTCKDLTFYLEQSRILERPSLSNFDTIALLNDPIYRSVQGTFRDVNCQERFTGFDTESQPTDVQGHPLAGRWKSGSFVTTALIYNTALRETDILPEEIGIDETQLSCIHGLTPYSKLYAGLDSANLISVLTTGIPFNFSLYTLNLVQIGALYEEDRTGTIVPSKANPFAVLRSIVGDQNQVLGNFQPFLELRQSYDKTTLLRLKQEAEATRSNLRSKLQKRNTRDFRAAVDKAWENFLIGLAEQGLSKASDSGNQSVSASEIWSEDYTKAAKSGQEYIDSKIADQGYELTVEKISQRTGDALRLEILEKGGTEEKKWLQVFEKLAGPSAGADRREVRIIGNTTVSRTTSDNPKELEKVIEALQQKRVQVAQDTSLTDFRRNELLNNIDETLSETRERLKTAKQLEGTPLADLIRTRNRLADLVRQQETQPTDERQTQINALTQRSMQLEKQAGEQGLLIDPRVCVSLDYSEVIAIKSHALAMQNYYNYRELYQQFIITTTEALGLDAEQTGEEDSTQVNRTVRLAAGLTKKFNASAIIPTKRKIIEKAKPNFLLVDEDYIGNVNLKPYQLRVSKSNISEVFRSSYTTAFALCREAAELVDFEFYCDENGHLRFKPPTYNRMLKEHFDITQLDPSVQVQLSSQFAGIGVFNNVAIAKRIRQLIDEERASAADGLALQYPMVGIAKSTPVGEAANLSLDDLPRTTNFAAARIQEIVDGVTENVGFSQEAQQFVSRVEDLLPAGDFTTYVDAEEAFFEYVERYSEAKQAINAKIRQFLKENKQSLFKEANKDIFDPYVEYSKRVNSCIGKQAATQRAYEDNEEGVFYRCEETEQGLVQVTEKQGVVTRGFPIKPPRGEVGAQPKQLKVIGPDVLTIIDEFPAEGEYEVFKDKQKREKVKQYLLAAAERPLALRERQVKEDGLIFAGQTYELNGERIQGCGISNIRENVPTSWLYSNKCEPCFQDSLFGGTCPNAQELFSGRRVDQQQIVRLPESIPTGTYEYLSGSRANALYSIRLTGTTSEVGATIGVRTAGIDRPSDEEIQANLVLQDICDRSDIKLDGRTTGSVTEESGIDDRSLAEYLRSFGVSSCSLHYYILDWLHNKNATEAVNHFDKDTKERQAKYEKVLRTKREYQDLLKARWELIRNHHNTLLSLYREVFGTQRARRFSLNELGLLTKTLSLEQRQVAGQESRFDLIQAIELLVLDSINNTPYFLDELHIHRIPSQVILQESTSEKRPAYVRLDVTGKQDYTDIDRITSDFFIWAGGVDYDLWKSYGWAQQGIDRAFIHDRETAKDYCAALLGRQRAQILSCSLTVRGDSKYRVGDCVFIEDQFMYYYTTAVAHSFSYGEFTTSLTLEYARRPSEFIPHPFEVIGRMVIDGTENEIANAYNLIGADQKTVSTLKGRWQRQRDVVKQNQETIKKAIAQERGSLDEGSERNSP